HAIARALSRLSGKDAMAWPRASFPPPQLATIAAHIAAEVTKVLVAVMLASTPAEIGRHSAASRASGDVSSLVIARVGMPARFASACRLRMSGLRPDCEMVMRMLSRR